MNDDLSHFDAEGRARMVDVAAKAESVREATARGFVQLTPEAFARVLEQGSPKGDLHAVAELAGVMAAKRTADLIPLCHSISLTSVRVQVAPQASSHRFEVTAVARAKAATGVEMEALSAVSVGCLALYDMLKALDRSMVIEGIEVLRKSGGVRGDYAKP
jgi:cyclic pyranopterin phosphate synthase